MGSRLYPPMRERMPGFRVNPNCPLYRDLKIAPWDVGSGLWCQSLPVHIPIGDLVYLAAQVWYFGGTTPRVAWHPQWRRHVMNGTPHRGGFLVPAYSALVPSGDFTLHYKREQYTNEDHQWPLLWHDANWQIRKFGMWIDTNWPYFSLNGVTIGARKADKFLTARYLVDSSQMQFWTEAGLRATGTATLPDFNPGSDKLVLLYLFSDAYHFPFGSDLMYWTRALTVNEIVAITDPENVDYRISCHGPPLLLPPARRYFPVATVAETKKIPWHLFFAGMSM